MLFNMKDNFESFKKSSFLGKVGYGTLLLAKGTLNVGNAMAIQACKTVLNNPNATWEQRENAQKYLDKYDK